MASFVPAVHHVTLHSDLRKENPVVLSPSVLEPWEEGGREGKTFTFPFSAFCRRRFSRQVEFVSNPKLYLSSNLREELSSAMGGNSAQQARAPRCSKICLRR